MKKIRKISIYVSVLLLAACGPRYTIGLDKAAQGGQWMSILQPVQDSYPQITVIDTKTGTSQITLTDADIYQEPITDYSPSGRYLLYRTNELWRLMEISSKNIVDFAPLSMNAEFLPDDEILITYKPQEDGQSQMLSQLWIASPKLPEQENWTLISERIRYIFRSRSLSLSDAPFLNLIPQSELPVQALCPPTTNSTKDTRIIVNADGIVTVLLADANNFDLRRLYNLSAETTDLLNSYEAMITAMQQNLKDQVIGTDETEKQAQVENAIARSGISGLASPDGNHLLLISATTYGTSNTKYSLNLISLKNDKRFPLSVDSNWIPSSLFSPDGTQIIYESNMKGDRAWYLQTLDGSDPIRLILQGTTMLCWY